MMKHLFLNTFLLLVVSAVSAADVTIERSGELRFAFGGGFRAAALVNYNNWGGFGGAAAGAARRDGIRSGNARASIRPRPSSSWSAELTTRACCSRSSRRRPPRRRNCSVGLLAKNGGQLDRRTLMRKLHVDHGTFKRIALTLHMCDMIDEERLDARKFIYTLKNAA